MVEAKGISCYHSKDFLLSKNNLRMGKARFKDWYSPPNSILSPLSYHFLFKKIERVVGPTTMPHSHIFLQYSGDLFSGHHPPLPHHDVLLPPPQGSVASPSPSTTSTPPSTIDHTSLQHPPHSLSLHYLTTLLLCH